MKCVRFDIYYYRDFNIFGKSYKVEFVLKFMVNINFC